MKKIFWKCFIQVFLLIPFFVFLWWPKSGFVTDEKTAVRIGEIAIIRTFGVKVFRSERPFRAALRNGVWLANRVPDGMWMGGVHYVRISQKDGHVLGTYLDK